MSPHIPQKKPKFFMHLREERHGQGDFRVALRPQKPIEKESERGKAINFESASA